MTANILFASRPSSWPRYQPHLIRALTDAGVDFDLRNDFTPDQVDYIVYAPNSSVQDFTP